MAFVARCAGTTVRSRTAPTTFSIVSTASVVQSVMRGVPPGCQERRSYPASPPEELGGEQPAVGPGDDEDQRLAAVVGNENDRGRAVERSVAEDRRCRPRGDADRRLAVAERNLPGGGVALGGTRLGPLAAPRWWRPAGRGAPSRTRLRSTSGSESSRKSVAEPAGPVLAVAAFELLSPDAVCSTLSESVTALSVRPPATTTASTAAATPARVSTLRS